MSENSERPTLTDVERALLACWIDRVGLAEVDHVAKTVSGIGPRVRVPVSLRTQSRTRIVQAAGRPLKLSGEENETFWHEITLAAGMLRSVHLGSDDAKSWARIFNTGSAFHGHLSEQIDSSTFVDPDIYAAACATERVLGSIQHYSLARAGNDGRRKEAVSLRSQAFGRLAFYFLHAFGAPTNKRGDLKHDGFKPFLEAIFQEAGALKEAAIPAEGQLRRILRDQGSKFKKPAHPPV